MMYSEKKIDKKVIYESPIFQIEHLSVELDNGTTAWRDIVRHNGGVCVVAIEGDFVYMVEQFRIAVGRQTLELPAGKLEKTDTPEGGAIRELREETGLVAEELIALGTCLPSPGYTSEVLYLYLARDFHPGEMDLDPGEFLHCFKMPVNEVINRIMSGEIQDAKTIIGLFKAREYLRNEGNRND